MANGELIPQTSGRTGRVFPVKDQYSKGQETYRSMPSPGHKGQTTSFGGYKGTKHYNKAATKTREANIGRRANPRGGNPY